MRMLLKWRLGTMETNEAIHSGRIVEINRRLDELTKPEAQYFCTEGGTRTGYVFFDLADPSDIPPIAEALFQELNATVEFFPAMNAAELGAGLNKASAATAGGATTRPVTVSPVAAEASPCAREPAICSACGAR